MVCRDGLGYENDGSTKSNEEGLTSMGYDTLEASSRFMEEDCKYAGEYGCTSDNDSASM